MSSLTRFHYDPFAEFDRLFDDAFRARFRPSASQSEAGQRAASQRHEFFCSRLDLHESKDSEAVTATFELPGLKSDDVNIDLQQNRLTISGESSACTSSEDGGYAVRERRYGKFSRTLQLPFGTKAQDVKAQMENGLLTVAFPKVTERQPQRITIQ